MKQIDEILKTDDVEELSMYLEYSELIEDMMIKRGRPDQTLKQEQDIIKERIACLTQNK